MDKILQKAIQQTEKVVGYNRYKHGAVVFKDNQVIGVGHNMKRVVPSLSKYSYRFLMHHAESHVLLKTPRDKLKGASLLVVRKSPTKLSNSKPCSSCMSLIYESGISDVYYSNSEGCIERIHL